MIRRFFTLSLALSLPVCATVVAALCTSCMEANPSPKQVADQIGQVMALCSAAERFQETHGRWPNSLNELAEADRLDKTGDDALHVRLDPKSFRRVDLLPQSNGHLLVRYATTCGTTGQSEIVAAPKHEEPCRPETKREAKGREGELVICERLAAY